MKVREESKKIIHQNIEKYALRINKSSSTIKRWLYQDNKQFNKEKHITELIKVTGLTKEQLFEQ